MIAAAFLLASLAWAAPQPPQRLDREVAAMGTRLKISLEAESRDHALSASNRAIEAVQKAERRLSTWRRDSELSGLNRAKPGREVRLSPELARDLGHAFSCARRTGNRFDPAIGPLISAWDLKGEGRIPSERELAGAVSSSGLAQFRLKPGAISRKSARATIEEGGFAKGAALDDATRELAASGVRVAMLDFGGQIALVGDREMQVSIADPASRDRAILSLSVKGGSISTSGNSEHGLSVGGRSVGHILDPSTGRPARFQGSVTVIAPSATEADCLSTGLFVMGPEKGLAFVREASRGALEAVFVSPAPGGGWLARASCGLKGRLSALRPDTRISFDCSNQGESS